MAGIRNWLSNVVYPKISPKIEEMKELWSELGESADDQEVEIVETMEAAEAFLVRIMDLRLSRLVARRSDLLDLAEAHARQLNELSNLLDIIVVEPEEGLKIIQLESCLQKRVQEFEVIRKDRLARLEKLRTREKIVANLLGEKISVVPDDLLTENLLDTVKEHVDSLEEEKKKRHEKLRSLREEVIRLMNELEMTPHNTFEKHLVCDDSDVFQLSAVNMNGVETLTLQLRDDFKMKECKARKLRENLHLLWEVLQVEEDHRKNFLDNHVGVRPSTIEALKKEINRCKQLKLENVSKYIDKIRSEISQLWDRCYYSGHQRRAFKPFYKEDLNEKLLEMHEEELQRLKTAFAEAEPVLTVFKKRAEVWEKMLQFEKPADDPQRFNNRGGRLLREEKERKKLMILFPKLEADLQNSVNEWEKKYGRRFLVYGMQVMDYVRDQWDAHRQEKENEKMERQRVKARKLEDELVNGSKASLSRKRLISTPSKEQPSKLAKVTPMSTNAVFNRGPPSSMLTSSRQAKPISKSTVRKTRVVPRRLLAQQSRAPAASDRTLTRSPSDTLVSAPIASGTCIFGTSQLSTYSEFAKTINRKWRTDNQSRSSAVTPQSPSTPHGRYMTRDRRLKLPFLL